MSTIIDPHTGNRISDEKIFEQLQLMMNYMQAQSRKIQELTAQQMHLGLFLEYVVEHLVADGEDTEPILEINFEQFPEWAQKRTEEIRAQAKAQMEQTQNAQSELKVNLDDIK